MSTTDTAAVNVSELLAELQWASAEHKKSEAGLPSEWDQGDWWCGTSGCVAGHTAVGAGHDLDQSGWVLDPSGCRTDDHCEEVACRVLGLSKRDGEWLFSGDNDIYDLWRIANKLTDGAVEIPEEYQL